MTSVSNAILLDTNVLVYCYDPRDRVEQDSALDLVNRLEAAGRAVLSVQCLTEFFQVVTARLPENLSREAATARIEGLVRSFPVLDLTPTIVLEAGRGAAAQSISIWHALIWATAKINQVPGILTEDADHGRYWEGVRYFNPFAASFDEAALGI